MTSSIRIGTRESQLAVWQATQVKNHLESMGHAVTLVLIKSEGDVDLQTPLYEMGVQGIFTRSLDIALLNARIDLAVHSMKDVPTILPEGITQAAVLKRGPYRDLLVFGKNRQDIAPLLGYAQGQWDLPEADKAALTIATSSIRRKAQWLHRYPGHSLVNLRGNVNTRLRKLTEEPWDAAIFAQAGLERIGLRPAHSLELEWMLPAPAQGAIMVACRYNDEVMLKACQSFNDADTETCTRLEREFLRGLLGGCSTPISALARVDDDHILFKGSILSLDGRQMAAVERKIPLSPPVGTGFGLADALMEAGGRSIAEGIRHEKK
jgi:hydroxymethylbilane synthase